MSGFDFESIAEREEFATMYALIGRANEEIDATQGLVIQHAGLPLVAETFPTLEARLLEYEAAFALFCIDRRTEATPTTIRDTAATLLPRAFYAELIADEAANLPPGITVNGAREVVRTQRFQLMDRAGFTGALDVHTGLQNTYLRADDAARQARITAPEIFLMDDMFNALVRANATPGTIALGAIRAIEAITPQALLDESVEVRTRRTLAMDDTVDPEDLAEALRRQELERTNPEYLEGCIPVCSALKYAIAMTAIDQIGQVWSPEAFPRSINSRLREHLETTIKHHTPLAGACGAEPTSLDLQQIASTQPWNF